MAGKTYDLNTLIWELKQATDEVILEARDMARLTALALDRLGCATAAEAYDLLYADWQELPAQTVLSGMRAGQILNVLPVLWLDQQVGDHRTEELRRAAREYGPSDPQWQAAITAVGTSAATQIPTVESPAAMAAALVRIEEARATLPPGSLHRDALDLQHAGIRVHLAQLGGGEDDFDTAVDDLTRLRDSPLLGAPERLVLDGQLATFRARQAVRREDEEALAEQVGLLESVVAQLPPDHMDLAGLTAALEADRGNLAILRARRTGTQPVATVAAGAQDPSADEVRRQAAALPLHLRADRLVQSGIGRTGRAVIADDPREIADSLGLLEDALDLLEPDDDRWLRAASTLGLAQCQLAGYAQVPPADRTHLRDQGISWLTHALRLAGGPEHPLWANTGISLAWAYRLRGDAHPPRSRARRLNYEAARRTGLDAVRAESWSAVLQSGTAHTAETARRAGERAADVARWCVTDGALDEAVRALDAGRGLVLHAATVSASVPDMLDALGQPGLAREWRAAGAVVSAEGEADGEREAAPAGVGGVPSGPSSRLRRRALDALAASSQWRHLLDVPSPEDIGKALRAMGTTALVYLIPEGEGAPGTALVVSADGTVSALRLPELSVDAAPLEDYRASVAAGRDAGGPPTVLTSSPPPPPDGGQALERLCAWAGTAVMGPLLKQLPRGYGTAPSVTLVPMGELGAVPWHAARLPGRRGPHRYACQEARISFLPSARMLCDVAGRSATPVREALVVGNPTRDLQHAGEEAEAIHRAFHPHGELLGPTTATPAAVTGWLRRQRGGGVLHLACHGVVRHGERHSSYLTLSAGQLAAEELTEAGPGKRRLELVVLAACSTQVSGRGYDEAYSLATAFLVAGARSVVGSMWPVPDEATSLLMYMTHHYMSRDGLPPGQALRTAQLWMLDGGRQAPPGMPPGLAARVPLINGDDLTGWAGFTHLGW